MSYFIEIPNYKTYSGKEANFHFSYNANSGGGQSFLGGKFINVEGELTWPTVLDDYMGVFIIESHNDNGQDFSYLLDDNKGRFKIKPRGNGNNSMKLEIGDQKTAPSKLISSFFMLPSTCTVNSSSNLDVSILTSNNFWLHSMWLECAHQDTAKKEVHLKPIDFIFSGGKSKGNKGVERYFKLDFVNRVEDILNLVNNIDSLPIEIGKNLEVFASIYKNESVFDYKKCEEATKNLMVFLAQNYPNEYSGIEDPLPFLIKLYNSTVNTSKGDDNKVIQTIYFGAPGTGKSYGIRINHDINKDNSFRTTFHPDSDYSSFVGCYKPIKIKNDITYDFVPQVFTEAYISAWRNFNDKKQVYLIIEEINRGNCAQIFGDLFQLLDRDFRGFSEFEIKPEKDLQHFLADEFAGNHNNEKNEHPALKLYEFPRVASGDELMLPPNLNIIATMNTSDQSLFPIDSAFKRRWNWHYVAIKDFKEKNYRFEVNGVLYKWWDFVSPVNDAIKAVTDSEDKKMGYFFVRPDKKEQESDKEATIVSSDFFVSKVLFYLWTDVFKDYTTDENNIFRKLVGKDDNGIDKYEAITFSEFFDSLGKVKVETIIDFLAQFKLEPDKDLKIEEQSLVEDEDGNLENSTNRDYTKYSVNGVGKFGKNILASEAVKEYIRLNPDMKAENVIANWKSLGMIVPHFFETKEEYDARTDRKDRVAVIPCGDTVVYVAKDGYGNNGKVEKLIEAVNQKTEEWGITLAKAK